MEWALTWELLKLCKLLNIYAPKASTSAWYFTFNNFFFSTYIYSIRAYLYQICVSNIYTYIQYPIIILNIQLYLNLLFLRCIIKTNSLQNLRFYQRSSKNMNQNMFCTKSRLLTQETVLKLSLFQFFYQCRLLRSLETYRFTKIINFDTSSIIPE